MRTVAIVFPFDFFGSSGTGEGAKLLGDALSEMLKEARRETQPCRSDAWKHRLRVREFSFDTPEEIHQWQKTSRQTIRKTLQNGEFLFWLAGNHLAVLPLCEELKPDDLIIQIDAHLDIFNLADCTEELSHGNFLMQAKSLPTLVNLGHRDLLFPAAHIQMYFDDCCSAMEVHIDAVEVFRRLEQHIRTAERIVLDIDCDGFDPTFFPAVQHPQPFGLNPNLLLQLLARIPPEKLIAVSISEFDPARDVADRSLATLAWFMEYLLLWRAEAFPEEAG